MIKESITQTVGNTPLIKINNINVSRANIYAKAESFNPLSSVKDRVALSIINTAEQEGKLKPGSVVVEASSGNTGIGLAFICARRGYRLKLTMPETVSVERRKVLSALGAELVLTPAAKGMKGAIEEASKILTQDKDAFFADQFNNPANPRAHRTTTAKEILAELNSIDIFVAGVGTGGTITGVGEVLKEFNPLVKIIAVEPAGSPVLSGGAAGPHNLQGIGAGFVPGILNVSVIDEIITVKEDEAYSTARAMAAREGLFCGITSGAAMFAALKIADRAENEGKNIVVILPDTGERYLSTPLF